MSKRNESVEKLKESVTASSLNKDIYICICIYVNKNIVMHYFLFPVLSFIQGPSICRQCLIEQMTHSA